MICWPIFYLFYLGEVSWTVRWYLAPQTGADEPSEALLQQALAIVK